MSRFGVQWSSQGRYYLVNRSGKVVHMNLTYQEALNRNIYGRNEWDKPKDYTNIRQHKGYPKSKAVRRYQYLESKGANPLSPRFNRKYVKAQKRGKRKPKRSGIKRRKKWTRR